MNSNPIRILHVIGIMDRAGAETAIMNLYRSMDRNKVQFDFLVHTKEEGDYDEEILHLGGRIYNIPRFTGANVIPYKKACRIFFKEHPEYRIVHGHIGSSAAIYLNEAKKLGAFTIAHSHSQGFPFSFLQLAFRTITFPTRFVADYFIACSQQAGLDRYGKRIATSNRYTVLKNGIDVGLYRFSEKTRGTIRDELSIPCDAIVFGHVGRFDPIKNHPFLIQVFSKALDMNPNSYLVLVGREDDGAVRRQCEAAGIIENVRFLGLREDVYSVLSAMDVFVFPSFKEGLSLATIEAQAAGLPCIVSTGVPQLAKTSNLVDFLPLSAGSDIWAKTAIEKSKGGFDTERANAGEKVRAAGFDIKSSAQWLEEFYIGHYA